MAHQDKTELASESVTRIIRHAEVCARLTVSSSKLFDMISKDQFSKPFTIIPGGRAVGWLESEVANWIFQRSVAGQEAA